MPSTVKSLGAKLLESKKCVENLIDKNTLLQSKNSKLKKKVRTLQDALKGTMSQVFQHKISENF
jgi:regulator of replication initiation timing